LVPFEVSAIVAVGRTTGEREEPHLYFVHRSPGSQWVCG
jgi:hypothetical protein